MRVRTSPPRVTVGVPVYNGERYLAATLDSLLNQTFEDFVILIGDNASTDGTEEIARHYTQLDSRVSYVRHTQNLGAAPNYNRLFEATSTEYFRWSAADDISAPRFLEACVQVLDADPSVVLAYPRIMLVDEHGNELSEYDEHLHLPHGRPSDRFTTLLQQIGLCNALYGVMHTPTVRRTRLMGCYRGSDITFQAELSLYGKFIEIPEVLFYRRMHQASFTAMNLEQQREFYNPGHADRTELYRWRHFHENVRSVLRTPIETRERLLLLLSLARWVISDRERYAKEIIEAVRYLLAWRRRN